MIQSETVKSFVSAMSIISITQGDRRPLYNVVAEELHHRMRMGLFSSFI